METRELRYFVALAEELHFGRAAARVGIEQSPLSKAISEMERNLDVKLFIRTRRSTTLTSVGEMLLEDARRILSEVDRARRKIVAAASGRSGPLRITVCDGAANHRIGKLISRVRRCDPGVEIQVTHSSFQEQVRGLRCGAVDIGFGLSPSNDQEISSIPLWEDAAVMVMSPEHRLSTQPDVKQIDDNIGPLMLLGERPPLGASAVDKRFLAPSCRCEQIEFIENIELLLMLVAAGYGVGIISGAKAETIRRPDLVMRAITTHGASMTTFMLQRREGASKLVTRFTEQAQKMLYEDARSALNQQVKKLAARCR